MFITEFAMRLVTANAFGETYKHYFKKLLTLVDIVVLCAFIFEIFLFDSKNTDYK